MHMQEHCFTTSDAMGLNPVPWMHGLADELLSSIHVPLFAANGPGQNVHLQMMAVACAGPCLAPRLQEYQAARTLDTKVCWSAAQLISDHTIVVVHCPIDMVIASHHRMPARIPL